MIEPKVVLKDMMQSVPWYFKMAWVVGVGLSLTLFGAVLFLVFKLISKL